MRNLEEFNGKHAGKPCFIIGAGTSLLRQDLSLLDGHVTIAVNSGYVAYPESTYYLSDDWEVDRWSYFFRDLKNSKSTIALLYDRKLKDTGLMFGNRSVLFKHRKGYHLTDPYSHSDKEKHICEARTAMGSAIHVAYIMKCYPIVLLGLDCCRQDGYRYFWQYPEFKNKPFRSDKRPTDKFKHTENTDGDLESILQYWKMAAKGAKSKAHILNASPISKVKEFPFISLKDATCNV